jgi:hypothetical protein
MCTHVEFDRSLPHHVYKGEVLGGCQGGANLDATDAARNRFDLWSITSRTTFKDGLYSYDAIGRAQAAATGQALARWAAQSPPDRAMPFAEPPIGEFVQLGPLGTAFLPTELPRVLLMDELDKSEVDLPNDLLSIFEDGQFAVPELERIRDRTAEVTMFTDDPDTTATIVGGRVTCRAFPVIVSRAGSPPSPQPLEDIERTDHPPPRQRVMNFLSSASPPARRLARLLAAVPASVPVARLIQTELVPDSGPDHLAEVFTSGLLHPVDGPTNGTADGWESASFDFELQIREILLTGARRAETAHVVRLAADTFADRLAGIGHLRDATGGEHGIPSLFLSYPRFLFCLSWC